MSYINRISVNNAESHDLFGLDTQIKVAYNDKTQGTKMTSLRNALFLHKNGDVKLGYILSGDSSGLGVNLDGSNSLLGYIEHCYDNNLTSKKVSATEQLSYATIVDSPINVTSGVLTFNNDNKSKQHVIKWGLLADTGMYLENLGSIYLFSGAEAIENDNESGFVLNRYQGTNDSHYLNSHTSLEPKVTSTGYLGTKEKRFFDIYTQYAHIDRLQFNKTTTDSVIYIDQAAVDKTESAYILTQFNIVQDASNLISSPQNIRWSMRLLNNAEVDQSHALTMGVPNFFSIKPSGHNGGTETSVVFQSIGSDENGYHPAIFPEQHNTGSLGQLSKRWNSLYVNKITANLIDVETDIDATRVTVTSSLQIDHSLTIGKALLQPAEDNTYILGNSNRYFKTLYVNEVQSQGEFYLTKGINLNATDSLVGQSGIRLSSMADRKLTIKGYNSGANTALCTFDFSNSDMVAIDKIIKADGGIRLVDKVIYFYSSSWGNGKNLWIDPEGKLRWGNNYVQMG